MKVYRSSNRIAGCLLATVTVLWLIPAISFAGIPHQSLVSKVAANPHRGIPPNCDIADQIGNQGNPIVHPPCSNPYGRSYGEWTASWWKWILAIRPEVNPNFDSTGEHCGEGQSGPVWFLPGSFGGSFPLRTCVVPKGTSFLLPLPNAAFGAGLADCLSPGWGNPGPCDSAHGAGVDELRAGAAAFVDAATLLEVSINGVPLQNLFHYRFQSPVFRYTVPHDNILSVLFNFPVPSDTYKPAVSDGYWIMFKPLPPGVHDIHIRVVYFGVEGRGILRLIVRK